MSSIRYYAGVSGKLCIEDKNHLKKLVAEISRSDKKNCGRSLSQCFPDFLCGSAPLYARQYNFLDETAKHKKGRSAVERPFFAKSFVIAD